MTDERHKIICPSCGVIHYMHVGERKRCDCPQVFITLSTSSYPFAYEVLVEGWQLAFPTKEPPND